MGLFRVRHRLFQPPGALRVYKLERFRQAQLLEATFDPPPVAEVLDRLQQAWDAWLTDGPVEEVRLRFSPAVVRYVAEARRRPSQVLRQLPDGGVELSFRLAPTIDLARWILSWGDSCQVLAPEALAQQVARAHRLAAAQDPASEA